MSTNNLKFRTYVRDDDEYVGNITKRINITRNVNWKKKRKGRKEGGRDATKRVPKTCVP